MIRRLRGLGRECSGAAAIEAAFALPVLFAIGIGVMQLGLFFLANAGLRQGVESGARYATIFDTSTMNTPTDAQVAAKVRANVYGIPAANLTVATPTRGTDATSGQRYLELTASYPYTFNFIFFRSSAITLRYTRRVYLMPI